MIILWLFVAVVLLLSAYHMVPRRRHTKTYLTPPDDVQIIKPENLRDEKDTKRYWNDIRSLYPL